MKGIYSIYSRMREAAADGPYMTQCAGIDLSVHPQVYAPQFFTDSNWFALQLSEIVKEGSLLEIGTGTGIIAIACTRKGATVTATDINPFAVANAVENVKAHGLEAKISVVESDMYDALPPCEKYDFIFWAHPFNNWPEPVDDWLLRSGLDTNYSDLERFIDEAHKHLNAEGKLLLGTGDTADLETIESMVARAGYSLDLLTSADMPLEYGGHSRIQYRLCHLRKV